MTDLEHRVDAREARREGIAFKAQYLTQNGRRADGNHCTSTHSGPNKEGIEISVNTYDVAPFFIEWKRGKGKADDLTLYGSRTIIDYAGQRVFVLEESKITTYVSGGWTSILNERFEKTRAAPTHYSEPATNKSSSVRT
jgi:hypothetical protein